MIQQRVFYKFLLAFVTPICDEKLQLFPNDFFDLFEGHLKRVAIIGVSKYYLNSKNNATVVSEDLDFAAEFKRFMVIAFGNTAYMRFVRLNIQR